MEVFTSAELDYLLGPGSMRECLFCELPIPAEQAEDEVYCDSTCFASAVDTTLRVEAAIICSCCNQI